MKIILLLAVLAVVVCVLFVIWRSKQDRIVGVAADDPEMTAAIAEARATLPQYWQLFGHPEHSETDFSLKVRITDKHGSEHFWVVDVTRRDGKVFGQIDNDPRVVKSVKIGDQVEVQEQDITDWGYVRDGKMYGKYTLRVIVKRLPAAEAAKYRSILANP